MLVKVAEKDKHYVGCEELSQSQEVTPEKVTSPTATGAGKKATMTLSLADSRMFVINNGEVMKEGGSMSTGDATAQVMDHSGLVSTVNTVDCRPCAFTWVISNIIDIDAK